jgi:cyclopropane-fatty-acyl-phospholipid synthase
MNHIIDWIERGLLPDPVIRLGIRLLDRKRLADEAGRDMDALDVARHRFVADMKSGAVADYVEKANEQHYELPAEFFSRVLGRHLKYSACYFRQGVTDLDQAEADMLEIYNRRALLQDGQRILDLGCGWGSFALWAAARYPRSRVTAVSNSVLQKNFITSAAQSRGIGNLQVITADMNDFSIDDRFDRVVSIEMFEHMHNWSELLRRIRSWLEPGGKLFVHIFTHRNLAYRFFTNGADNWLGRWFFTGGMMPSDDLIYHFQDDMTVEAHHRLDGRHYQKTAEAWLANLDAQQQPIEALFETVYGRGQAGRWIQRWRVFFMACAELWGYSGGREWIVSHYRLSPR